MKKAKFDFGEGGIQGFCIRHVEKFVLGVVAVLLVGFIYLGIQAPTLDSGKNPDDLSSVVKNAENTLVRTKWDDVKAKRSNVLFTTEKDVLSVQAPIPPEGYPIVQIFNRPDFPRLKPRTDPKILAPVAIRVTPIYGALHTLHDKDPQQDLSPVTMVGGGRKRVNDGTYKPDSPDGGYKSTYMMVVTAAVPYAKQVKEYEIAFQNSPDYRPENRDDVQYLRAYLQRAEVASDSDVPKEKDWKFIPNADWKKYRSIVGESTQEASLDPVSEENGSAITQPVPPILAADLSATLKHPDIPLRKPADMNNVGIPQVQAEEESGDDDMPPDANEMQEEAMEAPAGDEPPDSASILDRAIAEQYTVTARQLPSTRQSGKKPPKQPKKPKTGKAGGSMPPGSYGSPLGSATGSGGPPGMSGGMGMYGAPLGAAGGSGGPPGMSGGMGTANAMGKMMNMPGMGMQGMMPGMARPGISGMPGAYDQPRQVVPWKLLRFVDATAEPGKKYKYRVCILVVDPNRPRDKAYAPESSFLAIEVKERLREVEKADNKNPKAKKYTYWRLSDYSEASPVATLPSLTTVLAGGTSGQSSVGITSENRELDCPVGDQSLKVLAIAWDKGLATHVPGETIVTHGSVMHFNKKGLTKDEANKERSVHVVNPLAGDVRVLKDGYDWKSLTQVLDIQGGVSLRGVSRPAGVPTPKSTSEALLMDESGNLVVIDEWSSFQQYGEFTYDASGEAGSMPGVPGAMPYGAAPFGEDAEGGGYGAPPAFGIGAPPGAPSKAKPKK